MGFAHPDHLLDQLTSTQLSEWEAYDRLEPIGEWRADYRFAVLCSIISNQGKKRGSKLNTPVDLMKWFFAFDREEPESESEEPKTDTIRSWSVHGWVGHRKQSTEEMKLLMQGIASVSKKRQKDKKQ